MKAAVLKGTKQIEIEECEVDSLSSGEVLVKVKSCGICGTDQHIYHGNPGSAIVYPPIILGHELAGEIEEVGSQVSTLKKGDRVSIDPNIYCGICKYCRRNQAHLCENLQAVGVTRNGGMGEYCTVPEANCFKIPKEMTYEEAALVEPLGCVLHGFKKIDFSPLSTVLIIGGGFIGQLFLQLVENQRVNTIIVSEPAENKWENLYRLGADRVVHPDNVGEVAADIVIECVGRQDTMEIAFNTVNKGGQVLLFGVSSPDTKISISPFEIFAKELVIKGSFINPYTQEEAINLIEKKVVDVQSLISHRFTIEEMPLIMENYPMFNIVKGVVKY